MHHRTSRTNHVVLVVVGVLLLALGAFLIARYEDWISQLPAVDRLYSGAEQRWFHDNDWIAYVVVAAAVVIGLPTLRWLLVQSRLDRVRRLTIDPDPDQHGRTRLDAEVLTDAVEDDLVEVPGVERARVFVIGKGDAPQFVLRVAVRPLTDLADMRRLIADEALPAARTALDTPDAPAQLHLQVTGRNAADRVIG